MMKAFIDGPQKVRFDELQIPVPGAGEVVVKLVRASLCSSDLGMWKQAVLGGFGHDASAVVEAIGEGVSTVEPGVRITLAGWTGCSDCGHCRIGEMGRCTNRVVFKPEYQGFFSEYTLLPEKLAVKLPDNVTLDDGALIEAAYTGITGSKIMGYGPDDLLVIFGSGWMAWGQIAVASALGARPVAIGRNEKRLDLAKQFGAIETFSAADPEFKEKLISLNGGDDPHFLIDATGAGATEPLTQAQEIGGREAKIGLMGIKNGIVLHGLLFKSQSLHSIVVWPRKPEAVQWIADGKIDLKPCISHRFPFSELPKAMEFLDENRDEVTKIMIDFD